MSLRYDKLVPPDTFIGRYMQMMSSGETALAYDFWTAVWALGVIAGRGVVVARPRAPVFLNWYVILVAESGTTRKSTAVREATKIARVHKSLGTHMIESRMTPGTLEKKLNDLTLEYGYAHAAISIPELVTFLGRDQHVMQLPGVLTDLYDCPDEKSGGGTITRGDTAIKNVYLSFLSASAPSWLARAINPDVIEGGFTSRTIFVHSERAKKRVPWPEDVDETQVKCQMIEALKTAMAFKNVINPVTTIDLNPRALKHFKTWYNARHFNRDPFRSSFEAREDAHVLRLAACLCINDGSWIIQVEHVRKAITVIQACKEDGARIFESGVRIGRTLAGIDVLRQALCNAGLSGIAQGELSMKIKHKLDGHEMITALRIMQELDMVQCFEGIKTGVGRPKTIWRATKHITARNAIELIEGKLTQ